MKNFIELKYKKNSKFEMEFENLDEIKEGDNVILYYSKNDIEAVLLSLKLPFNVNLYIPYIPKTIVDNLDNVLSNVNLYTLDSGSCEALRQGVALPKWNIPEDNAILFLSGEDREKYEKFFKNNDIGIYNNDNQEEITLNLEDIKINKKEDVVNDFFTNRFKNISLILPQLHAEPTQTNCIYHINNVNKVCKELKEKYGVERIELFVSHCYKDLPNVLPLLKCEVKYHPSHCPFTKKYCKQYDTPLITDIIYRDWTDYKEDKYTNSINTLSVEAKVFLSELQSCANKLHKYYLEDRNDFFNYFTSTEVSFLMLYTDFNLKYEDSGITGACKTMMPSINKITTTNSTGILEVQKRNRLEVIDVKEFFV